MIKSIKFKNSACFLNEQTIEVFSNKRDEIRKRINLIFGVPSTGKTSIFELLKTTIYYMRRWLLFNDDIDILSSRTMGEFFNPNINTQSISKYDNFTVVEIVFDNDIFSYKYELSFNKYYCSYEKLSYKINDVLDDWIELFDKQLIDYVKINDKIETIFETYVNLEELEIDFRPTFKGINQNNSVLSYITSISNCESLRELSKIIDKISFFDSSDFMEFKNFNFPSEEIEKNKEYILFVLDQIKIHFDDIKVANHNKITGYYSVNLYKNPTDEMKDLIDEDIDVNEKEELKPQVINSSRLSKAEIKLFLFSIMFMRYRQKECILFVDDFSSGIEFNIFFRLLKAFEKEVSNDTNFQLFAFNNHFFNKVKAYDSKFINIFDIEKNDEGISAVDKETRI